MSALVEFTDLAISLPEPTVPSEPTTADLAPATPTGVADLAKEIAAPVALFATTRVEVVEEWAFRALFLVATAITVHGLAAVL